jgi:dipeptidyl aminopeptidase/acylaminoacyl peptidase
MNPDGTGVTRLTNNSAFDDAPVWSPDMSKVAFLTSRDGNNEIYTMNPDGTNQLNITNNPANDTFPAWSPDGTKIVFSSDRDDVQLELYTMNADGTNVTRLTNNSDYDDTADWSPDGTRIVFSSFRDGNYEIYQMKADGTNQTRCTNTAALETHHDWSPDGSMIDFSSDRDGNHDVFVMNADCSSQTNRTNNAANDLYPVWSPDGTQISFYSDRDDGTGDVFTMNADGTGQTNRTTNAAADRDADWGRVAVPPPTLLTAISPAKIWVGLKNSDDVGTKFDLRAEVYKDNTLVSSGQVNSVSGGSSGFNNAKLDAIAFDPFVPVVFTPGSQLKLKLYVRNTCTGPTHNSGTARLWFNDSAANSRFDATIGGSTSDYFLLDNFLLGTSVGPGPKKTIDVAAGAKCSPFKSFGTWTLTQ